MANYMKRPPRRTNWIDRVLMVLCIGAIGLGGSVLLAGWFGLLSDLFWQ